MQIIGTVYAGPRKEGDFVFMLTQPEYSNALFLFNDDIESVLSYKAGGGNAIIRKYNQYNPKTAAYPRAAGIPTGSRHTGGFAQLGPDEKRHIDEAFAKIRALITKHHYSAVLFSADAGGKSQTPRLGTGIFTVGDAVIDYITAEIYNLANVA